MQTDVGTRHETWSRPATALSLLVRGRTAHVAAPVAAVVGTVLSSVNQGAIIASGDATLGTWIRVAVNYFVPFLVSSYGYLPARRVFAPPLGGSDGPGQPASVQAAAAARPVPVDGDPGEISRVDSHDGDGMRVGGIGPAAMPDREHLGR
jgi:hypothetical protein